MQRYSGPLSPQKVCFSGCLSTADGCLTRAAPYTVLKASRPATSAGISHSIPFLLPIEIKHTHTSRSNAELLLDRYQKHVVLVSNSSGLLL